MRRRAHSSRCTTNRCAWKVLALLGALVSAAAWGGEQAASVHADAAQAAGVPRELLEVERSEEEDPLAERITESVDEPRQWADTPNRLRPYGSIRLRYRVEDGDSVWSDGGTRAGLDGLWQFRPKTFLLGTAEVGLNLLDELDLLSSPSSQTPDRQIGDSVFLRLLYVGVETENGTLTFGKNWSAYYQVSKFTDQFQGAGANATGTFNAGTDGGETGTGRANRTLQARFLARPPSTLGWLRPFRVNVQAQYGEPIPKVEGASYGAAFGISAVMDTQAGYSVGVGYNRAHVQDAANPAIRAAGINGDARALVAGVRWIDERWNVATTGARLINQDTTDQGIYYDGWGWEVSVLRRLTPRIWAAGGWNWNRPDGGQPQAGSYQVKYAVFELRYTFREFGRMLYASWRWNASTTSDGQRSPDMFTVGVRFDLP